MSIVIHPELEAGLQARAEAEGLTVQAYLERIARDDEAAEADIEALEGSIPGNRSKRPRSIGMRSVARSSRGTGTPALSENPLHD